MGSIGSSTSTGSTVQFEITSPVRGERITGEDVIKDAKEAINKILDWDDDISDVDRIWEALADYYPQAMYDDDSTKAINFDLKNGTVDMVSFDIRNDLKPGKLSVELSPLRFDLDEFDDNELERWNIKRIGKDRFHSKYEWR